MGTALNGPAHSIPHDQNRSTGCAWDSRRTVAATVSVTPTRPETARGDTVKLQSGPYAGSNMGRDQMLQKTFLCIFCLDRPQYLVVLTDHSLDAMSEMR